MTAPSPGTRVESSGLILADGFSSKITLTADSNLAFWEKQVTPPAVDGGDAVEQTTMFNTTWRTKLPRDLLTLEDPSAVVAYDPLAYDEIIAVVNENSTVTIEFSDGSTLAFFGYLKRFEPSAMVEGEQPEATVTFVVTNIDSALVTAEEGPVLTEVAGT